MKADDIVRFCLHNLDGTVLVNSWGEKGIFYNPGQAFKRGIYVLTVKEKDGENDKSSDLNREDVYRLNVGVRKETFLRLFGEIPARPPKGGTVDMKADFTATDQLLPHPVYAWMAWVCCLNPTEKTFEELKPLIREAYEYAKEKYRKREPKPNTRKSTPAPK